MGWAGRATPRLSAAVLLFGFSVLVCAGCALGGAELVLYNGQHPQTTDALVTAFEQATGIRVAVRNDDEDVLADQIVAEGSHSPADLVYTENSPALEYLQERHLLAPVDPATLAAVSAGYDSPQGDWVGVSARVSVLIYNTGELSPGQLPTSVLQLAQPFWRGKLAIAAGETDFQPIVASVARNYGQRAALDWLRGLKTNAGNHVYPDNETVTDQVNRGTTAIGIINQYYWYRERVQVGAANMHSAIAYFAPHDPGYVLDVSGAAVLASSHRQAAAQRFLAFLVSRPGQEIIAHSDSFEYPIGSGVTTAEPETPFDQLQPNAITVGQLGDGASAIALLEQVQLL